MGSPDHDLSCVGSDRGHAGKYRSKRSKSKENPRYRRQERNRDARYRSIEVSKYRSIEVSNRPKVSGSTVTVVQLGRNTQPIPGSFPDFLLSSRVPFGSHPRPCPGLSARLRLSYYSAQRYSMWTAAQRRLHLTFPRYYRIGSAFVIYVRSPALQRRRSRPSRPVALHCLHHFVYKALIFDT